MSSNKKLLENFISRVKIYLLIIFLLLVIISIQNNKYIFPSILFFIGILIYSYIAGKKRKSELSAHLQDLTTSVNSAAKNTLLHSPFPLIILEMNGNVIWRSEKFAMEFANIDINNYLNDILVEINLKSAENTKIKCITKEIEINNRYYKIIGEFERKFNNQKKRSNDNLAIIYFIDETDKIKLKKEYDASKSCVGIIMIDNYDDTMQRMERQDRPQILAEIEKRVYKWIEIANGIIIKTERDSFVLLFENRFMESIKQNKFSILDEIKEINSKMQITLSIAISNEGKSNKERYKSAMAAMDIVLGRGGDQAAIRENGKYLFYGGRVEEVERRTKVKARIIAHALQELIQESNRVVVMGHINPDVDAAGSALGIYRIVRTLGKEAYIAIDYKYAGIQNFVQDLFENEEYKSIFKSKDEIEEFVDQDTLIIIVDTHKKSLVESQAILEKTNKIAIIDHHRRSEDYIKKSMLTFQEVYASSAAELVTEILQYIQEDVKIRTIEAESLYAGIMVDTKNFTFKTGVRTFEAAAFLRKCGVDIIKVKKWFQSDLQSYSKISDIVKKAEIIRSSIAISEYNVEEKETGLICAKAADELLTIGNITASFVLGKMDSYVVISGRSIGDINVQIILEKLGGGGHINLAGAQVEGEIDEVKNRLIEKIDEYFSEII